jgi:hypothetical protein
VQILIQPSPYLHRFGVSCFHRIGRSFAQSRDSGSGVNVVGDFKCLRG